MDTNIIPRLLALLPKYLWLWLMLGTFLSALVLKFRSRKYIRKNPSLEPGYRKLFLGFLVLMNLLWIAMGIGMIFGGFESGFELMGEMATRNPFSVLFWVTILVLMIPIFLWVLFLGGAKSLAEHPGAFNTFPVPPVAIKIFALLLLPVLGWLTYSLWKAVM